MTSTAELAEIVAAIEASWCAQTSATPDAWLGSNPAKGQCDVSSFVAWEYLGGALVLGEVHSDGEFQEYHYWNRLDGVDFDLTERQFMAGEVVTEKAELSYEHLSANQASMRPEFLTRVALLRRLVAARLG